MKRNSGFIQLIIIILLVVVVLSLLGVNLTRVSENTTLRDNFSYIFGGLGTLWSDYLSQPFKVVWRTFLNLIGEPFWEIIKNLSLKLQEIRVPAPKG